MEGMFKESYFFLYWFVGAFQENCKALLGFFLCIFISSACLKKPVFIKQDLPRWKVIARLYRILLTSGRC